MSRKRNSERRIRGVAKQIGLIKADIQNVRKLLRTQFFADVIAGIIISITISIIFKLIWG